MNTNASVRDFFRKMADGSIIPANRDLLVLLHNSNTMRARPAVQHTDFFSDSSFGNRESDFGVGLPPLANC